MSIPYIACPLIFSGLSSRFCDLPIYFHSLGSRSLTEGIASVEAAIANSP
jgi:hypothetical protein